MPAQSAFPPFLELCQFFTKFPSLPDCFGLGKAHMGKLDEGRLWDIAVWAAGIRLEVRPMSLSAMFTGQRCSIKFSQTFAALKVGWYPTSQEWELQNSRR